MFTFENVTLQKLEKIHLMQLLDLKGESWFGTHSVSFVNYESQEVWFNSLNKEDVICPRNLVLVASTEDPVTKIDGAFGVFKITNIHWVNRTADVAWDVFALARGKKLGKPLVRAGVAFCFEILNLRRLNAEILRPNVVSQKCAAAAGFVWEGQKREAVARQDRLFDSDVYGILEREWFEKNEATPNVLVDNEEKPH